MKIGAVFMVILLLVLIGVGTVQSTGLHKVSNTPEAALQSFFEHVKAKNWDAAFSMVQPATGVEKQALIKDLGGNNESLKTISPLQSLQTKVLHQSPTESEI